MRRRDFVAVALAEMALVAGVRKALAQESVTVNVGAPPIPLKMPKDEPLVVWIEDQIITPVGQFANVAVFVNSVDWGGWVRLTKCDERMIPCESIPMRIDASVFHQGQFITLALPE